MDFVDFADFAEVVVGNVPARRRNHMKTNELEGLNCSGVGRFSDFP